MSERKSISYYFSGRRVVLPVLIGLAIASYFIWKDFDIDAIREVEWRKGALMWLFASILMMALRDVGYIIRLRILSSGELSWRQCFEIAFLWEFASAISPSAIGGTAVAVVIMAQEKIKTGLTTAIVLVTAFLDELFYIIMVPLMLLLVGSQALFPSLEEESFSYLLDVSNLKYFFWLGYFVLFLWTLFLAMTILIKPEITKRIILFIYKLPGLRSRRSKGLQLADDIILASKEFRIKNMRFWLKAFGATFLSWTARFLMLNCLLMAFSGFDDHLLAYGRQLVMWVILLVAVTPGASGIAEGVFPVFMKEFLPGRQIARLVAIVWRMISYYPYLLIGFVILPLWLSRVQKSKTKSEKSKSLSV